MEESVPGTSVFPTLTRLGATHVLKFACTPVPLTEIVAGELVALLATEMPPVTLPVDVGAKVTFKAADCPGDRTAPDDRLLALKPAPVALTLEMVTLELPEFVSVTPSALLALVSMFPKLKLVGLTLST
jgi:hypothetical protein